VLEGDVNCVQMCIGQRCTAVSSLPVLTCPDCHNHGVCSLLLPFTCLHSVNAASRTEIISPNEIKNLKK